ncbi:MAG: hypothetical protein U0441_24705 [Polyangiaceae bacterium]
MRRLSLGAVLAAVIVCAPTASRADEPPPPPEAKVPVAPEAKVPVVPEAKVPVAPEAKVPVAPDAEREKGPAVRLTLPPWMPDVRIQPGMDVVAAYSFRMTLSNAAPMQWFHAFEVPRAIASARVSAGPATSAIAVEGVYSSSEGALVGVAGDSFVVRVREASVGYRLSTWLAVDAGIVPTLVIPTLDTAMGLRALAAASVEQQGILSPADLGLSAKVAFPKGYGFAAAAVYNGEGYTNRELNRGKNVELAALVRPSPGTALAPLGLFASYQNGSTGTGLSRADRVTGALLWEGERVRGAAAFTYAFGVQDVGARQAAILDVGVRGEPIVRWILAARAQAYFRDMKSSGDRLVLVTGATGVRIAPPLEAFVALTRSLPGGAAAVSLPGSDYWEGRTAVRLAF